MRVICEADGCEAAANLPRNVYKNHYDPEAHRAIWRCRDHREEGDR